MVWRIEFSATAEKQFRKLDALVAKRMSSFLRDRLATLENPRSLGAALQGNELGELWKYRVGDWRLICRIQDHSILITIVKIGNRSEVYKK
jgi:mRNA interferase RelE/StbE